MKFLCDRCKTRYTIGDDRVRGKILKIRCKNCANVITVREGMTADDPAGRRSPKPTTMAPAASSSTPVNGGAAAQNKGALGAAFASAMTKPAPAIEEEWYVSINGEQEGPFSLAEAQRWVASRAADAELHCWCEGFDDWLPVDKVSQFRGLRKKPATAAPPPIPARAASSSGRLAARGSDDEPKPLFAATMATLEKSQPATSSAGLGLPAISNGTPSLGQPAMSAEARANGSSTLPAVGHKIPAPSAGARVPGAMTAKPAGTAGAATPATRATPVPGPTTPKPAVKGFDLGADAIEDAPTIATAPIAPPPDDDPDDDLSIGEVSRVVNLADLARSRKSAPNVAARTTPVARMGGTGSTQAIAGGIVPSALADAAAEPGADASAITPPVADTHRRHMITLLSVAGVLLAGVVVVVVVIVGNRDQFRTGLGRSGDIDTTRPDDILRKTGQVVDTAPNDPQPPGAPKRPRTPSSGQNVRPVDPTPSGDDLRGDEIEAEAAKHALTTQRCYMRAQKGAEGILIGDIKKIEVTLTVDKSGLVTDVKLSQHQNTGFGRCLTTAVSGWKFRPSSNGITSRITLAFQGF
ncbi:MAG: GYF domain-containing protein [Kofleriaceae bacterium]